MELTIDKTETKQLLKEVVLELVQERHELFLEIMLEAIEEAGLIEAIQAGRQHDYVEEEEISICPGTPS
jgi:hypothetical protein